ncbi:MAG: T9SS type A sorting domain-containing protein [Fibromonadales bacterium]|nr:T9SS type A sorting domain-containing protein [Fibromonadales bacterium]
MKKVFLMPMIAIAMFVSQVGAQECAGNTTDPNAPNPSGCNCGYQGVKAFCQHGTGCYTINNIYENLSSDCATLVADCIRDGMVYTGVSEKTTPTDINNPDLSSINPSNKYGQNVQCKTAGGTWRAGNSESRTSLGCCKWADTDKPGTCWDIWSDDPDGEAQVTDCKGGENQYWDSACPNQGSGNCPGGSPVLKVNHAAGLIVATHGRALHISSDKKATVNLYTLAGQQVLSGSVQAGNSVFSLMGQNPGVYYAVVQSGSYTQTVNVVLK